MAVAGEIREQLARLSKAELIQRIEALRRKNRRMGQGETDAGQRELPQRDSEILLRHAVEMANLGYWIWDDRENRCVYCSEQLARMNGVTVEEYLSKFGEYGALLENTIHPEDRAHYDQVISKALELKEPYQITFRGLRAGGEIRYLREAGEPVLDEQGELAHTVGILQDITEAKRLEDALRASEERSRSIAEESPVMLWMCDAESKPTFYNQASLAFMGRGLEEALSYDLALDVHPDDRARIRALDYEDQLEPRAFQREYRLRRADGVYRWVLDVGSPCFGPGGKFEGYSGYCLDITETKRAAELLKEGEERFRAIANDLPAMIWAYDRADQPTFFNRSYLEFAGLSLEQALSSDWYATIHPDDRERLRSTHEGWLVSPYPYEIEYRERRADGAWRWILDIAVPRFAADGSFQGSIGSSLDVTGQKTAEAALREREAWFREVFEESPVSLWVEDWTSLKVMLDELTARGVTDLRGYFHENPDELRAAYDKLDVIDMSRETLRVFKADSKEALIGSFSSEHASPEALTDFSAQIAQLYGGAAGSDQEALETACDGSSVVTRTRTVIPPSYRETWSRVFVSVEDVSAQRSAERAVKDRDAKLRDQQRELERVSRVSAMAQLSATLSNEISEPLTAIMNYAAAARRTLKAADLPVGDRVVEMLDKAIGQARQASAVTRQVKELYEKVDTEVTPHKINKIVDEALALALIDPTCAGMHCDLKLGEQLPEVRVNKVQIQQVIYNLIKNAVEAMGMAERRLLTIETLQTTEGGVRVTVSDSGPGLAPEIAARLFEPFVTSKPNGLGLGLSISRGIVEGYRGRLWVDANPGGATCFHVTLPSVPGSC